MGYNRKNATERIENNQKSQRIAFETHHKLKPSKP